MSSDDDRFENLPEDVILVILNKVWDAKSIFRCSSVCRRFASLTPLVHNVALSINPVKPTLTERFLTFLKPVKILRKLKRFITTYDNLQRSINLSRPLSHFREIHHLHLDFPHLTSNHVFEDSIRWGFSSSGEKLRIFAFFSAARIYPIGQIPNHCNDNHLKALCRLVRLRSEGWIVILLSHIPLLGVIKTQPGLRVITSTVTELGVMREMSVESLMQVRESLSSVPCDDHDLKICDIESLDKPSITLPVSGYVMEGLMLVIVEFGDHSGGISHGAVMACFEEEDDVHKEAVEEMLKGW